MTAPDEKSRRREPGGSNTNHSERNTNGTGAQVSIDVSRLDNVHHAGSKTIAACPACREAGSDKTGNHLFIGADGRFGCVMFSGPDGDQHRKRIFELVGIRDQRPVTTPAPVTKRKTEKTIHATVDDAVNAAIWGLNKSGGQWSETSRHAYQDQHGAIYAYTVRLDRQDAKAKKQVRPISPKGNGYSLEDPGKWLPYRFNEIDAAGPVHVFEGEKCVDAAASIGLVNAITSSHGAKSASMTDWSCLAGRDVVIHPDSDDEGRTYADDVARLVLNLDPPGRPMIAKPFSDADGYDVADLIAEKGADALMVIIDADFNAVEVTPGADEPEVQYTGYTVRGWGEVSTMDLKPRGWFWGEVFATGQIQSVIGQGGLGKSRIGLNLVRNQVLGFPFAGMDTGGKPLVHLMMGSENSIHRLQHDVRHMSLGLTTEQLEKLAQHVHMATIEQAEDGYISLESDANVERWRATIERFNPDVLWVDPYGDVHAGDGNSDSDTRFTIATLSRLVRQVNPEAGIVILHHSRTGANNIMQATGFDAANFGKGSKALFSSCRAVVNLAPFDESESPPIICVCGKNNNAKRFDPVKLVLDENSMTYSHEPVDVEAWRDGVRAVATGKRSSSKQDAPLDTYHPTVIDALTGGPLPSGTLHEKVKQATGLGDKKIDRLLADCVFSGVIAKTPRMKERDGKVLYGTPNQVAAIMNPELQGVKS